VETFDVVDQTQELCEALGKHFFIQLKSIRSTVFHEIVVAPRNNVELYPIGAETTAQDRDKPWLETAENTSSDESRLQVIKHQLATSELITIQSFGPSAVVLLVITCLDLNRAFFVCLNDYIDNILLPVDPSHVSRGKR
jgi:hypothetical protein